MSRPAHEQLFTASCTNDIDGCEPERTAERLYNFGGLYGSMQSRYRQPSHGRPGSLFILCNGIASSEVRSAIVVKPSRIWSEGIGEGISVDPKPSSFKAVHTRKFLLPTTTQFSVRLITFPAHRIKHLAHHPDIVTILEQFARRVLTSGPRSRASSTARSATVRRARVQRRFFVPVVIARIRVRIIAVFLAFVE